MNQNNTNYKCTLYSPSSHISDVSYGECVDSMYIKPYRIFYTENGVSRVWDCIESLDSVAILLYHKDKDALVFVKQFRPALYAQQGGNGYTYELCAGLVDKSGKSVEQIAKEEVSEECGYEVHSLRKIAEFVTAVGHSGARQIIFYATISESHKKHKGGGVDGEVIETIFVPKIELEDFLHNENIFKTPGLGYGILWFLRHYKQLKQEAKKEHLCKH